MTLKTDNGSLNLIKEIDLSVSNPPVCPARIVKLPNEHFIVCDEMNHRLVELSSNGNFLRAIGQPGKTPCEFIYPRGLAVDTSGNIYVADSGNHRVQKLSVEGKFILEIKGGDSWLLNEPADVAILEDGSLVIVDSGNHRIIKTTGDGKLIKTFGSRSSLTEEKAYRLSCLTRPFLKQIAYQGEVHFEFPKSVSVARNGQILIADPNNQRIAVTTDDGYFVNYIPLPVNTWLDSIHTSRQGFIFLTDTGQEHSLKQLTPEGILINSWKQVSKLEDQLHFPGGLLICEDQLYLCDSFNHRILLFQLSEVTPKQTYLTSVNQEAPEPIKLQKYALHLETTQDFDEAKIIYQKLINSSPDYLPGYYHYLNYLTKFPDAREVKKHLPILAQKIIDASKTLISQMNKQYQEALICNQELAKTRAAYEQETLTKKTAADSLVAKQELLTQRSRQLAMKLRETAVEIEETWQLLAKICQRVNSDDISELSHLSDLLAGYLSELLDNWAQLCQRDYSETLVNWEKKFTKKGAAIAWSDVYLAQQQIVNERAVNAARSKLCYSIIDSLVTIFRASSCVEITIDNQNSILTDFGKLCCYFTQDSQELEKLLSKFMLLKNWLNLSPLPECELPEAIDCLVKQLKPPFTLEEPRLVVQLLTNKMVPDNRLKLNPDIYYELERVKSGLVSLIEHWQARMLSNYSHHIDGLTRSAQLKNTLKTIKKENKQDLIQTKQQTSLTNWTLQLSRYLYQQADFWVNRLFSLYMNLEEESAAFLLTLSTREREKLLARISDLSEPTWGKTTEQHLEIIFNKREETVNELAKWDYVSEQEVERWGYIRPGTKLYLEAAKTGWNLLAIAISGLNDNLETQQSLKIKYLIKLANEVDAPTELAENLGNEILSITNRLVAYWSKKNQRLAELEKLLSDNSVHNSKQSLLFKKIEQLFDADHKQTQSLLEKWHRLSDTYLTLCEKNRDIKCIFITEDIFSQFWHLHPSFSKDLPLFLNKLKTIDQAHEEKFISMLILNALGNHDEKTKELWATLLNQLKVSSLNINNTDLKTIREFSGALIKLEKKSFAAYLEQEKLAVEMMGLLEMEINPLIHQKNYYALKKKKIDIFWQWFLLKNKVTNAIRLNILLWRRFFIVFNSSIAHFSNTTEILNEVEGWPKELKETWEIINADFINSCEQLTLLSRSLTLTKLQKTVREKYLFLFKKTEMDNICPQFVNYTNWLHRGIDNLKEKIFIELHKTSSDPLYLRNIYRLNPSNLHLIKNRSSLSGELKYLLEPITTFEKPGKSQEIEYLVGGTASEEGYIFITNMSQNKINKYENSGKYICSFGELGNNEGQFKIPWGIATGPSNQLYISERHNHRIQVMRSDGTSVGIIGSPGKETGQLNKPAGIKLDCYGNLYVNDTGNRRLQVFNPSGDFICEAFCDEPMLLTDLLLKDDKVYLFDWLSNKILAGKITYDNGIPTIKSLPSIESRKHIFSGSFIDDNLFLSCDEYESIYARNLETSKTIFTLAGLTDYKFLKGRGMFLANENGNDYLYFLEMGGLTAHKFRIIKLG